MLAQLHVSSRESGEVYLHGELEHLIDPKSSTWCTDGSQAHCRADKEQTNLHLVCGIPSASLRYDHVEHLSVRSRLRSYDVFHVRRPACARISMRSAGGVSVVVRVSPPRERR
eukprot:3324127-Pleurochrysis_carterae.AAC.3